MILVLSYAFAGDVTVTTENVKVSGANLTNNTINLGITSSVNVTLDVKLKTLNGATTNTFGNLFLYYKASSTENEVQVGFAAVTFIVTYPPFVTQTTYTSSIPNITVTLTKSAFFASGGVFYAKYINNNNVADSSSNILVAGGSRTTTTPNPPYTGTNTVCCSQTIRKGDKVSLTGSALPTDVVGSWHKNGYPYQVQNYSTGNSSTTFESDYFFDSCYFSRNVKGSYSNRAQINVVPNPIGSNVISTNAIQMGNGNYEISQASELNLTATGANVNLNVLANPNHTPVRGDNYANSNEITYQWQYRYSGNNWKNIPNGTTDNIYGFVPEYYTTDYNFRRIAKYQNISLVSNVITIVFRRPSASNTLCCSQTLTSTSSSPDIPLPQTIIGSVPEFSIADGGSSGITGSPSMTYQWQEQGRSFSWTNIAGANGKDFLPPAITTYGTTINYRRIVRFEYYTTPFGNFLAYDTYSNVVSIGVIRIRQGKMAEGITNALEISLSPNPTSSILNVSSNAAIQSANFKIFNSLGQEIQLKPSNTTDNQVSIDVSGLQSGIYYVAFKKDSKTITKKFIKE
ncbi:MAG: T9SS type A sorting domain-containing protein [Flavobacterium sp.]